MNTFFLYLLKSGIWIAVFWLIYWLFLRKETFFRFNRMFLFAGLPASLLLSLLQYTYRVNLVLPVNTRPVSAVSEVVAPVFNIDFSTVLLYFYLSGVAIVLLRNLIGIVKIRQFIRKGEVTKHDRIRLVQTALIPGSFSFFNYIFMNNSLPSTSKEQELIIEHEKVHVFQEHWLDLLVVELICALQWFNPFIYLYRKSIKENQEFMADKAVLEKGNSPVFYQAVLINNAFQSPVFELTNSFTHNKFKRISIMKTTVNRPARRWASLLVLPAIVLFLWAFAKPAYSISYVSPEEIISVNDTIKEVKTKKKMTGTFTEKKGRVKTPQDSVLMVRGKQHPLIIVDGKERGNLAGNDLEKILDINADDIESLDVWKDKPATDRYGKKGKDGVIVITMKTNQKNKFFVNNDTIKIVDPDAKVIGVGKNPITIHSVRGGDVKPLYIIDGIEIASDNVLKLDPKDIESIEVLKDKVAIERYGEKGKDGVVLFIMK
ncbi:transcriptional regulator [Bacteroidia bacterium]|nr:transcriptional regulator [Bacteroidia bacterium]